MKLLPGAFAYLNKSPNKCEEVHLFFDKPIYYISTLYKYKVIFQILTRQLEFEKILGSEKKKKIF